MNVHGEGCMAMKKQHHQPEKQPYPCRNSAFEMDVKVYSVSKGSDCSIFCSRAI
jgi:hypothetical protein